MRKKNIIKIFASVSGLMVIDKILGFVKQMYIASTFGATVETDIINLSQSAVTDIQYILAQALITSFISIYIYLHDGQSVSEVKSKKFAGDTINAFALISIFLTIILNISAPLVSKLLAPSYNDTLNDSLTKHIRIYSIIVILFSFICIFRAVLSANKNFIPEQLISFNQSVITIGLVYVLGNKVGPTILVASFFCFTIWNTLYLAFLCRKNISYRLKTPLKNSEVVQLFKMMGPLLIGYSLIYINQMVDRMLVSGLGAGVITSLTYGATLSNLITAFITTFCSMIFSYITSEISANNYRFASSIANNSLKMLSAVFLPITIVFVICSHDIVAIVYGRGAFDNNAVNSASLALKGYAVMFVPVIIREIYTRFQYAFKDSKRPMINGSIGIGSNIILSIIFCKLWGVFGVAFATSLSVLISAILNMETAKFKTTELKYTFLNGFLVKFVLVSIISICLSCYAYKNLIDANIFMRVLIIAVICFFISFVFFCTDIVFSIKELKKIGSGS